MEESNATEMPAQLSRLVKISRLSAEDLPKVGLRKNDGKFYIKLSMSSNSMRKIWTDKTQVLERTASPAWDEGFSIDCNGDAVLKLELFTAHRVQRNELVATFQESVKSLVERAQDGIVKCETAKKYQVKFKIEITSSNPSPVVVVTGGLSNAVADVAEAANHLNSPNTLAKVAGGVTTAKGVLDDSNSVCDTWKPLLEKVKVFSNLMDKLVEVILSVPPPAAI